MIASCLLGLSVIVVPVVTAFTWRVPAQATAAQIVEHATGRLTIVSVLIFALVMSSRNYSARSHHGEAMRFKALTLQTYSGLVVAAEGSGNQGVILERAVDAIFAPVPSGFLSPQPSGTEVIQFVGGLAREFARPPVKGGSPAPDAPCPHLALQRGHGGCRARVVGRNDVDEVGPAACTSSQWSNLLPASVNLIVGAGLDQLLGCAPSCRDVERPDPAIQSGPGVQLVLLSSCTRPDRGDRSV